MKNLSSDSILDTSQSAASGGAQETTGASTTLTDPSMAHNAPTTSASPGTAPLAHTGATHATSSPPNSSAEAVRDSEDTDSPPTEPEMPMSPAEASAGARDGYDLLRRLSLGRIPSRTTKQNNLKDKYRPLGLSGRIISASFAVPYTVSYGKNANPRWELGSRRGTSALFDAFSHLSSPQTTWQHTLVAWTGEIRQHKARPGLRWNNSLIEPITKASIPAGITSSSKATAPQNTSSDIRVSKADRSALEDRLRNSQHGEIVPVWLYDELDEDQDQATFSSQEKWRRYAEHELYNLLHYKMNEPSNGKAVEASWRLYVRLNEAFADRIMELYQPGDLVMVHDYHLLLLPAILRKRAPDIYISLFIHVPFPSSEIFRCLPTRTAITEGMVGANVIGVQAGSYADYIAEACRLSPLNLHAGDLRIETPDERVVGIVVCPIGINLRATLETASDAAVVEKMKQLREQYAGMKVIVGRDRLDSLRGIAQKLQAYEVFLERHPEFHRKVTLIQVTSPTSVEDKEPGTDRTAREIGDLVNRITGTYGSLGYEPIRHCPQYLPRDEYFALLRIADLALITSVRDGMNTTSLEFVACQQEKRSPLILSEFSGTSMMMGSGAISINPWDLAGTADEINRALIMSGPDKEREHKKLFQGIEENTVQDWAEKLVNKSLEALIQELPIDGTPLLNQQRLLHRYNMAKKRLFMFDYDGTLTPIVRDPSAARPTKRLLRSLAELVADKRNAVWIISGRDQEFLEQWMGHISGLGLSAEHGCFLRYPGADEWQNLSEKEDMSWQESTRDVFYEFCEQVSGTRLEVKKVALTWHYRGAMDRTLALEKADEVERHLKSTVARNYDVEVMRGKMNIEVRPRFVNKGEIVKRLVHETGGADGSELEFVLCLGDDFTDEDMFRSLRGSKLSRASVFAVSIGEAEKETDADYHLLEPADVISTVMSLNGHSEDAIMEEDEEDEEDDDLYGET